MNVYIGIVGMGSIGRRHHDNFKALGCDVVGYDPNIDMWKGKIVGDALQRCDGIVIASPSALHFKHIREYSAPLFVEKPLVMTEVELNRLGVADKGRIKMVGYNLRFHSCVEIAKEWMGQGLVGKPLWARFICAQYNDKPAYRRDGVILNWSHEIDLAMHLLGKCEVVNAVVERNESYANINMKAHAALECDVNVHLDYLTSPERRGFTIVGDAGSMTADLVSRQIYVQRADGKIIQRCAFKDTFDMNYMAEAKTFLALLKGEEVTGQHCTAQQAADVVAACLHAKEIASV